MAEYPIVDVSTWRAYEQEPLGTKRKIWLEAPDARMWLFKYRHRPMTGDDWAEKIACEIARLLGIPHAEAELATFTQRDGTVEPGVILLDFTDQSRRGEQVASGSGQVLGNGELVLGNQLLFEQDTSYPQGERFRRVAEHTVDRVLGALAERGVAGPDPRIVHDGAATAGAALTGYLMLDALIGNQDRHHQNWGILVAPLGSPHAPARLAPTFDHASSLGQILRDEERRDRLETRDSGRSVTAYVRRARSALYGGTPCRQLGTFEAFEAAARRYDLAARFWLDRLEEATDERLAELVEAVPDARMSRLARRFAIEMLRCNRELLLGRRNG